LPKYRVTFSVEIEADSHLSAAVHGFDKVKRQKKTVAQVQHPGEETPRSIPVTHRTDQLTPMEARIAHLYAEGNEQPEIARMLYISPDTVQAHVLSIYRKLGIGNRIELIRIMEQPHNGNLLTHEQMREKLNALTPREFDIAMALLDRNISSRKEIAAALGLCPKTVDTHLTHINLKLGTRRQIEVLNVLQAMQRGAARPMALRVQPELVMRKGRRKRKAPSLSPYTPMHSRWGIDLNPAVA
jgi:DNA-binding CsgD family transcriptional regulator